ncbi:hypothetical protein [Tautonia plasticadhaerens]|uniref:HTH merR-type domain-containing protein n=1 Tax=Tautonia plasticadhaerens TaxID=2527974 RepID=A0A518H9J3_9BACT|nr:hypothetical protein [Tautonia plasticadhaerens]QDV37467.1 hypothetical protein ElP_54060 [Tautonia plasticadhaerens]
MPAIQLTTGMIARRLDEPLHRVTYIIRTRGIEPAAVAGKARVFEEEHLERIAAALRDIDARRDGGG